MFSVLARRADHRAPATLLALAEVLPRRQRADRDERVGGDRPSAVVAVFATRASAPSSSTASSLLMPCHPRCLLLLDNFSADVGVFEEFLVGQINICIPRLDPVLVRDKRKVP